ncbi:hypothetical protein [Yinghuangia soli]|uniref:Uncharacterized protein n=1 Tax=Yinghuangia soli TaxID=2908204 RepID=A0AA41PXK3_9ACTN|nr:hypothetical protein [Yinghuangia soli]MCF2527210.1 hypothetical protein [Yinghuangia soli]
MAAGRCIRKFPHTGTGYQFYRADSFQAYVDLGRSSVATGLRAPDVQAALDGLPCDASPRPGTGGTV